MHEKTHRAIFTCNECGCVNLQVNKTYAQKHYHMHQGTKYPCPHCPAVYDHQTSYCNHVRMQHPAALDACDQCGETFAGRRGLVMHKARAHGTKYKPNGNLKCTGCDVTFLNAEALQRHEELGAGVPHAALWPCAACGESCGSETALKKHAAEHQTDRHRCDECNKTFLNSKSFELHVQRKHMNKRASVAPFQQRQLSTGPKTPALYVCEICGKTLKNGTQMQYHRNVHLAVKPFQCQLCPKAYASKLGLNQHILVHTGERPFKCDQCPLAFRFKSNLVKHVRHVSMGGGGCFPSGDMPWSPQACPPPSKALQIHLQQPKLVTCVACDKVMCAASLALHVRTVHQNQKLPRNVIARARWILALGRRAGTLDRCALVCRRHFEECMLRRGGRAVGLIKNAVPTLFMPPKRPIQPALSSEDTDNEEGLLDSEPENQSEDERRRATCTSRLNHIQTGARAQRGERRALGKPVRPCIVHRT
ncbi:hypothetical protein MSG28_016139 [Choristoneura fumiferana]|uniref:Uncharacterized protein n=1 Tax=Choristoneura fumiferana TaxID=7141 RepID=A0ACC0K670_CHOFU|nr:hypothetical protein MSG28_016139 [Choristoneura fumiferana]